MQLILLFWFRKAGAPFHFLERKKIVDLLYPLLLLYRLALYTKLNIGGQNSEVTKIIRKKANTISLENIARTLVRLNNSINLLEQNPNRLLLLFNLLKQLP